MQKVQKMKESELEKKADIELRVMLTVQNVGTGICLYLPARIIKEYGIKKGDHVVVNLESVWKIKGVES